MREIEKKSDKQEPQVVKVEEKKAVTLSYEDQKKQKTLQNRLSKIESEISDLEKKIAKDDERLAVDYEKLMQDEAFFSAYEKNKKKVEGLMQEWEDIAAALM